jgi:hypothetical protein
MAAGQLGVHQVPAAAHQAVVMEVRPFSEVAPTLPLSMEEQTAHQVNCQTPPSTTQVLLQQKM